MKKQRHLLFTARTSKSMTQADVAKIIGITSKAYGHIETGRRNPSWEVALRLERFFGIPISELLDDNPDSEDSTSYKSKSIATK